VKLVSVALQTLSETKTVSAASPLKSPLAARELGITYHQLIGLLRFGKIDPPPRDSSGDYLWFPEDLRHARRALARERPRHQEVPV
jgi:hypothetical protein